ncbi:hypothetical protein BH11BAC5_BH11BAC5_13240 [soil metagenome]
MIIDSWTNATKYFRYIPLFERAFNYISNAVLHSIPAGKYIVDAENIKAIFYSTRCERRKIH